MSPSLYREFTFSRPEVWQGFVAFLKANAQGCLDAGSPLRVIVTTEESKRKDEQNRYYWGRVMRQISEQAWVNGRLYDSDVWHEHYARKYGVCEDIVLPNGETITRRKSTTQMTVREFSEYTNRVEADAATELGVQFL